MTFIPRYFSGSHVVGAYCLRLFMTYRCTFFFSISDKSRVCQPDVRHDLKKKKKTTEREKERGARRRQRRIGEMNSVFAGCYSSSSNWLR